jgi:aspartate aminotransferase
MKLSDRIQSIEESKTVRFSTLIRNLRKMGKTIIDLAVGEPGFDTPRIVIESTKAALDAQETRYGPVAGLPELKAALAETFEGYGEENIILSNGSKQSLYSIFQVICDPDDEVIIPKPFWVSFSQQVKLAGAEPVFVGTRQHQPDVEEIDRAITQRTKAIVINSPNNPTGAVYPKKYIEAVANLALVHDLYIVSDESYNFFVYDGIESESIFHFKTVRDRALITRSFSKHFGMTGFRIGYIAASSELIQQVAKLQSHLSGNVCTFAQHGALAAVSLDPDVILPWRAQLQKKRDLAYEHASTLFECIRPQGAFYIFPDVSNCLKDGETSEDLASRILSRTGVAVVPGEAFGMPNHIRISYAVPENLLVQGFEKIAEVL